MDEIIYLESDEEITSVIDKIKRAENSSIGLVVPRDATLLQSVVNLRLLAKEAAVLHKKISIVTTDKIGRNLAAQVGLPVYSSVKEEKPTIIAPTPHHRAEEEIIEINMAEQTDQPKSNEEGEVKIHHFQEDRQIIHWRPQEKPVMTKPEARYPEAKPGHEIKRKSDHRPMKMILPILIVLLVLAGIAAYLLWPKAVIKVYIKAEDLKKTLPIVMTTAVTGPDINQNVFPGKMIDAVAQNSQKFPTTGQKNEGGKAAGALTFINGLDSLNHKLPAGTKLLASSKTFLLKSDITVPGATVQNLQVVPGSVVGQVEAENAGEDYNIKAGRFTISGLAANQQQALYAEGTKDLTGGFTKVVQVVSQDDYDNAKKTMLNNLGSNLDQELLAKAGGLKIIDQAVVTPDPEVTSSSNVNQEAQDFQMTVKTQKQVVAFDLKQFENFLLQSLTQNVDAGKMVVIPSENDLGFVVDKTVYDKEELDLTVNVDAKVANKIKADEIKTNIISKNEASAQNYILSIPGVQKADFVFTPGWWKKIPDLSSNVTVQINYLTQ